MNIKNESYDYPEVDSKCNLCGDADLRYTIYQGAMYSDDPLAVELNVNNNIDIICIYSIYKYTIFLNENYRFNFVLIFFCSLILWTA